MEKHNVSRLIGAPPGYVGFEEGGQLTEKIRRRPYAVVLLDEIEKAHPDVFNMLLQVMEEGRLTDSFGRNVDFRNTILIMTTNAGAEAIKNETSMVMPTPPKRFNLDAKFETELDEKLVSVEIKAAFKEHAESLDDGEASVVVIEPGKQWRITVSGKKLETKYLITKAKDGSLRAKKGDDYSYESMKERVTERIERVFRPEFLNRVDDLVVFRHLTRTDLKRVIDIELKKVRERLGERGLALNLTEEAKEYLIDKGSNTDFGARPLRRAIENYVEDPLSEELLKGEFQGKDTIVVDVKKVGEAKQLVFEGSVAAESEASPVGAGAEAGAK
jgi:ATP-dependent Clp protease ATP-binding subunit ClpA